MKKALIGLWLFGLAAPLAAQPDEQPVTTFRTGVDLVAVDVSVVDRNGRPVHDLGPDDFVLTVDGRPRRLVSAEYISQVRSHGRPVPDRPAVYSSNTGAVGGRLIMFVVDKGNIRLGEGRALLQAASRFIDRLNPADRIALAAIPGSGPYVDFTTSHALVKAKLETVVGSAGRPFGRYHVSVAEALAFMRNDMELWRRVVTRECAPDVPMPAPEQARPADEGSGDSEARSEAIMCERGLAAEARTVHGLARQQTNASLIALRELLKRLALSSVPKTMILVSEGLVVGQDFGELERVGEVAAAARTNLYVLRLDGPLVDASMDRVSPSLMEDRQLRIQGLEALAGMTRGRVFTVAAGADPVFDRLAHELSGYYLLSFEPEPGDRDARPHAISVDVRRRNVEVRARREFRVEAGAPPTDEDVLADVLRTPLLATDLEVRATTFTLPHQDSSQLRVVIAAEVRGADRAPAGIPVAFTLVDANNRLVGSQFDRTPPGPVDRSGGPHHYLGAVLVDPGAYTLKLAVVDPGGQRGSVEHAFEARLSSAGQLKLGDLMLAEAPARQGETVRPSIDATIEADAALGYVELHSEVPAQLEGVHVTFEIAEDEARPAIETGPARLQPVEGTRRIVEGALPIALLPPGDYVARAVVSAGGRPVARVTRPFRLARPLAAAAAADRTSGPARGGSRASAALTDPQAFDRSEVLGQEVVGYFLDRMHTSRPAALPAGVAAAVEHARGGRFAAVHEAVAGVRDDELTVAFLRGLALYSRGELDPAANEFRRALRLSPEFFPAIFYLGACYAAGGRDLEAAGAWQTSLVAESDASFIYRMLADALLRLREGAQAVDILEEAVGLWPDAAFFTSRLASAYALEGRSADALATLEPHIARHPDDADALLLAMRLLYEARAAGRPLTSPASDRERFSEYARSYAAAQGPQQALVRQWQQFMERDR